MSIKIFKKKKKSTLSALDFINIGIANHALCLIEKAGILKTLVDGVMFKSDIKNYSNPPLILSALATLVGANVLTLKNGVYELTELGKNLSKNISLISLPLVGYRKLFENQLGLLKNPNSFKKSDIDFPEVALASIHFGKESIDPLLVKIINAINPKGTVCDLGCGTAEKLLNICKQTSCSGLGIEKEKDVIYEAKKYTKDFPNIEIVQGDLNSLQGVWEDVAISLMSFVYHDMESKEDKCSSVLEALKVNFPRMSYLIIIDIVAFSEEQQTIMPGFDYVHGLQSVELRTHKETIESFKKANYSVHEEFLVPNMPNTYIWVLSKSKELSKG